MVSGVGNKKNRTQFLVSRGLSLTEETPRGVSIAFALDLRYDSNQNGIDRDVIMSKH